MAVLAVVAAVVVAGCGTPGTKLHVSGTGSARPGAATESATAQPAADGCGQMVEAGAEAVLTLPFEPALQIRLAELD